MSELIEDIKEDIKREDLLKVWNQYGNWIIGGVFAFILVTSGILYWQHRKEQAKIETAQAYEAILQKFDARTPEPTIKALQEFSGHSTGGFKMLADFMAAGLLPDSVQALKALAEDSKIEKPFREMALVLAGMADLDGANPRAVLDMLSPFESSASPFRPLAREVMGYALIRLGNLDTAYTLFESLVHDQMASQSIRGRAEAMIQYIRGARG
jgi:hypothetical protein